MDFLGVGPLEFFLILLLALLLFGPHDMVKAGKTLGRWLRRLVTSPTWQAVQDTSRELTQLPTRLMREAGLDELEEEMKSTGEGAQAAIQDSLRGIEEASSSLSAWTTPPNAADRPAASPSTAGEAAGPSISLKADETGDSVAAAQETSSDLSPQSSVESD